MTTAFLAAISLTQITNIAIVALGLGMVIFFHELGHFAVAKWCDVKVERFSIGFGPILLKWTWGETEYALSVIPFGGYVKMLGQDDADPGQMADEDVAEDPRSYTAKSVPARMAIISAGVIMNVITGLIFFAIAFRIGVEALPPVLGSVTVGQPAWEAGLRTGDEITEINGRRIDRFTEIVQATVLSWKDELIIEGVHADGTTFKKTVVPELIKTRRRIGVGPTLDPVVARMANKEDVPYVENTPAAEAKPTIQQGDRIVELNGREIGTFEDMRDELARITTEQISMTVVRGEGDQKSNKTIVMKPWRFRSLGLWMDIGQVASIQKGSPAQKAGIKVGDKIIKVEDKVVGQDINSLRLPNIFAGLHGKDVKVTVLRESTGEASKELDFELKPLDRPGWVEVPSAENVPLSIPAIGVAYHLNRLIMKVDEEGPAAGKVKPNELINKVELFLPEGVEKDHLDTNEISIPLGPENPNFAYAFYGMQEAPQRHVRLTIKSEDGEERTEIIKPEPVDGWYWPKIGLRLTQLSEKQQAEAFGEAVVMGYGHTRSSALNIYMTLQNLIGGRLSIQELHGPFGIASVAYQVAAQGFADFLLFLGFLSINLAVLNFLPIPVLDGGHMVFLIWEGITRKKPSEKVVITATYFGLAFVLSLMMFVIYLDLFKHDVFGVGN